MIDSCEVQVVFLFVLDRDQEAQPNCWTGITVKGTGVQGFSAD